MDQLTIKGLKLRGLHGYHDFEREQGNDFEIDLIFTADLRASARGDDLSQTIDYQDAVAIVEEVIDGPSQKLIETLAATIGDRLFDRYPSAQKLTVALRKLSPPLNVDTDYSEVQFSWKR